MKFTKNDIYISGSVNSIGKCISWGKWLVCGMSKSIVLINQSANMSHVIQQFTGHKAIVTCVSWVTNNIIISGDNNGEVIIWRVDDKGHLIDHNVNKVDNFQSGVTDISGVYINDEVYVLCCCEDRWTILKDGLKAQTLSFSPLFVHSVNVTVLKSSLLLICCGLSDGRVVCQSLDVGNCLLSAAVSLTGHEDTVVAIDTVAAEGAEGVFIATASLDCFVRVWEVRMGSAGVSCPSGIDFQRLAIGSVSDYVDIRSRAVLAGHENWVTGCRFCTTETRELLLVTTSMDKSVIVWRCEEEEWCEEARLGQVGGNGLGFLGGSISPCGTMIVGVGYQGTMIVWCSGGGGTWRSVVNVGGHFDSVEDVSWERVEGRYLLSVSKDQTSRVHAKWHKGNEWHEVGRPQVHGYDMTCVASVSGTCFVSGAQEKISRVFSMNRTFHDFLVGLTKWERGFCEEGGSLVEEEVTLSALGLSATVAKLTVAGEEECPKEEGSLDTVATVTVTSVGEECPKEDSVAGRTLWPEVTKLYGHVHEVVRVSSSPPQKHIVATTCKAPVAQYADIILWDTLSWTVKQRLPFHRSTVVRVQFSRTGDRMVSVSKDRQWALWKEGEGGLYELAGRSARPNCHSKIIWDVDWTADGVNFVTVSRDQRAMVWDGESGALVGSPLALEHSINAVSTMPVVLEGKLHIFALGLESGDIKIVAFDKSTNEWSTMLSFKAHYDWITRLAFNPLMAGNSCLLASCSQDRFVKIFNISFE